MAQVQNEKTLGEKLLSIPRGVLFLILILATAIPLRCKVTIPNSPAENSANLYRVLMSIPEGSTVLVQSDWTNSTRGESRGQFDALLRILMRRNIKFAMLSVGDPQAPQVAKDVVDAINRERAEKGQRQYRRWEDWLSLGLFPNAEGTGNGIALNLANTFATKEESDASGMKRKVMLSPVFKGVESVGDIAAYIIVTGTKSSQIAIERLNNKVTMLALVTGVMGPETLTYYASGQLKGMSAGLKGVYDLETMMESGLNVPGSVVNQVPSVPGEYPGFPGETNLAKGTQYILTLHSAIFLLITAVVIGNIGVILSRKKGQS